MSGDEFSSTIKTTNIETYNSETGIKTKTPYFGDLYEEKPLINIRVEPVRPNELLYDNNGLAVAIKINGEILPILKGDE